MPRSLFLDIHCAPCHQATGGAPDRLRDAPRLARFWHRLDTAEIGVEPFAAKGGRRLPAPPPFGHQEGGRAFPAGHRRPDGGWTWDLRCPKGHNKPIQHEKIRAAFGAFPTGTGHLAHRALTQALDSTVSKGCRTGRPVRTSRSHKGRVVPHV